MTHLSPYVAELDARLSQLPPGTSRDFRMVQRHAAARGWNDAARLVQQAHDDWHQEVGPKCWLTDPLCNLAKRLTPQEDT